jgi:hypothetical protein
VTAFIVHLFRRRPRLQLHQKLAVQCIGNSEQSVNTWRAPSALEPRDRRLGGRYELSELGLRKTKLFPPLRDSVRDLAEEPATVRVRKAPAYALECVLPSVSP